MIIIGKDLKTNREIQPIRIGAYASQMIHYLQNYLGRTSIISASRTSKDDNEKSKIMIRTIISPNDIEFQKDYKRIEDKISDNTIKALRKNLRSIMVLLGHICECIIIDNCKTNRDINVKCINLSQYKPDIYEEYEDINYDLYTPYSPSHKKIILYNNEGMIYFKENKFFYEPNHINKDIVWCNKNNITEQLKVNLPNGFHENARLQIKASTSFEFVPILEKYLISPIVYFDICKDVDMLRTRHPDYLIKSAMEIDDFIWSEAVTYFRILAAYFTGLITSLDELIEIPYLQKDCFNNAMLKYLINADINCLLNPRINNNAENVFSNLKNIFEENNEPKAMHLIALDN